MDSNGINSNGNLDRILQIKNRIFDLILRTIIGCLS